MNTFHETPKLYKTNLKLNEFRLDKSFFIRIMKNYHFIVGMKDFSLSPEFSNFTFSTKIFLKVIFI